MAVELRVAHGGLTTPHWRAALRGLQADDWPAAARIYWDGIRRGLASFETEVPSWEDWNARHLEEPRLAATVLGELGGWAGLSARSAPPTPTTLALAAPVCRTHENARRN